MTGIVFHAAARFGLSLISLSFLLLFSGASYAATPVSIQGWIDAGPAPGNPVPFVGGWTCVEGQQAPIKVRIYVGGPAGTGTLVGTYPSTNASEPAVAAACGTTGADYRFSVTLPAFVFQQYAGDAIYAYGVSSSGVTGELAQSGLFIVPTSVQGWINAAPAYPTPVLTGWACMLGSTSSIKVQLYVGGPQGTGTLIGTYPATGASQSAVASACGSTGANYGYSITLSAQTLLSYPGQQIYVYGVSAAGQTGILTQSGMFAVPYPSNVGSQYTLQALYPQFVNTMGANNPSYAALLSPTSPATPVAGDTVESFDAPNGKLVTVVVKSPVVNQVYQPPLMTAGQDPATYIQNAITAAGNNTEILFPQQVYNLAPIDCATVGTHLALENVNDLVLNFNGGQINFQTNCTGWFILGVNRVVFENLTIDWPNLQTASLATITAESGAPDYLYSLQLEPQYVANAPPSNVTTRAWDPVNNYFSLTNPGQATDYPTYNNQNAVNQIVDGVEQNLPGNGVTFDMNETVIVEHFAGGPGDGTDGGGPIFNIYGNDVTFDNLTIKSSPGAGFVFSQGRGFRIANSTVTRTNGRLMGLGKDGMDFIGINGDVIIEDNIWGFNGDDVVNIGGSMTPLTASTNTLSLPPGAQAGDTVGFFNTQMAFTGVTATITSVNPSAGEYSATLNNPTPASGFASDLALTSPRYIIRNNQFAHNSSRDLFLASPYGLIQNNSFTATSAAHIDFISSLYWNEGPGVQNLLALGNQFSSDGYNESLAAVVADQESAGNSDPVYVPSNMTTSAQNPPVHQNIVFANNTFTNEPRGAFYLSFANDVILYHNSFTNLNQFNGPNYITTTPYAAPTNSPVDIENSSNTVLLQQ